MSDATAERVTWRPPPVQQPAKQANMGDDLARLIRNFIKEKPKPKRREGRCGC